MIGFQIEQYLRDHDATPGELRAAAQTHFARAALWHFKEHGRIVKRLVGCCT